jgi:hypothetical protein
MFTASACGRVVEFRSPHAAVNGFPLSRPPEKGPPYVKLQTRFSTSPVQFLLIQTPLTSPEPRPNLIAIADAGD